MPDFSLLLSLIHSERAVLNHRQTDIHLKRLSLWKQVNVCSLVVVAGLMLNVRLTNGGRLAATAASCLRRRPFPEFPPENTERATGSESETSLSSLHQITAAVYTPRTAGCLNLSWQTTKIKAFKLSSRRVSSHVNTFWPEGRVNRLYSFYFQEPFWKKMMHVIKKTSNLLRL